MPEFDAYTATMVGCRPEELVALLEHPGASIKTGRGFHTFAERASITDGSGEIGAVSWGGERQGGRSMIEVKGSRTPEVVKRLRASRIPHQVTRVDSCQDWDRPGAWDEILAVVLDVKQRHKLYGERRGDWEFPEKGRTQYLGAPSSSVKVRFYEKGKQPEYAHLAHPDHVRLEAQVRPAKQAKQMFSELDANQVWGASKFTRELASLLLLQDIERVPAGTLYREPNAWRTMRYITDVMGATLTQCAVDVGGWSELGLTIKEMVDEAVRAKHGRGA